MTPSRLPELPDAAAPSSLEKTKLLRYLEAFFISSLTTVTIIRTSPLAHQLLPNSTDPISPRNPTPSKSRMVAIPVNRAAAGQALEHWRQSERIGLHLLAPKLG